PPPAEDPPVDEASPTDAPPPTDESWVAPPGAPTVEAELPVGPDADALEAEYRAFLERFERESGA
ncbi:MAG: hypothetical protein V2J16_11350, partial [Thermoleophilia bacterium]|nr:hypothetical protein [Thermoleophilia bacterium]